jgi:hypothetical protein
LQKRHERNQSKYCKAGGSKRRIKGALDNPICRCACKLPLAILIRICIAFWNLMKQEQDCLLWTLQHETGKRKIRWFLQGLFFVYHCLAVSRFSKVDWICFGLYFLLFFWRPVITK